MRKATAVFVVLLTLVAAGSAAQTPADATAKKFHRGAVKIRTGLALVGAGAVMLIQSSNGRVEGNPPLAITGMSVAAIGGYIAWLGAQDQRHAAQPHTSFGIALGPTRVVLIRKRW
jgi:hypothetical protein